MSVHTFKFVLEKDPGKDERVIARLFCSFGDVTPQLAGELRLEHGEWQHLATALSLGVDRMNATIGRARLIVEGELKALGWTDWAILEATCYHCDELVLQSETRERQPVQIAGSDPPRFCMRPIHSECQCRSIVGSVGHQKGLCSCLGGPGTEDDPPGMTKREAARAAMQYWYAHADGAAPGDDGAGFRWDPAANRYYAKDAVEKRHTEEK